LAINILTPPKAWHAILLGNSTCLLNAFTRLEKEQREKKRKMMGKKKRNRTVNFEDEEKPSEKKRKNFGFSGEFGKLVFTEM